MLLKKDFFRKLMFEENSALFFTKHIQKTNELYNSILKKNCKTFEENNETLFSINRKASLPNEREFLSKNNSPRLYYSKENFLQNLDNTNDKSSYNNIHIDLMSSRNSSMYFPRRDSITLPLDFSKDTISNKNQKKFDIKQIFTRNDYSSFLNKKLDGYKDYLLKKSYFIEKNKKSKIEVLSYMFDQSISKTKTKKVMEIRLKNIADLIRKKNLKSIYEIEKPKEKISKKVLPVLDFFKIEEAQLNNIRQKINKAFLEETKIYNQNK